MATYPPNTTVPKKGSDGYLWNWLGTPLRKFAAALSPYMGTGGGGFSNYTEVDVSAAQFMGADTTPIILLPDLPLNSYYEWKIMWEFNTNTVLYDAPFIMYQGGGLDMVTLETQLLALGSKYVSYFNNGTISQVNTTVTSAGGTVGELYAVRIATSTVAHNVAIYASSAPTVGDGAAKAKIWYTIHTIA